MHIQSYIKEIKKASKRCFTIQDVVNIFAKYCDYNKVKILGEEFIRNLEQKKDNRDFRSDMNILLPSKLGWNFDEAYQFVLDNVISRLP